MRSFFFSVVFFSFCLEAVASKTYHRGIALEDVVRHSDVVVVAVPADPARRTEDVDITPKGQKKNKEKWPPFTKVFTRWTVQEVIEANANTRDVVTGSVIEVASADGESQLELHKKYYVEKISKSPIYERYVVEGESQKPERILFLEKRDQQLAFTVSGALELIEHRALVDEALAKKKQKTNPSPTPD